MGPQSSSLLFCEMVVILPHPFSIVTTTSQLFSDHLSSFQFSKLFSTALKVVPSLLTSAHLFSPLLSSSQLFSTTLTSGHLVLTLLNSSQLFSPLVLSTLWATCQLDSMISGATYQLDLMISKARLFSLSVSRSFSTKLPLITPIHSR